MATKAKTKVPDYVYVHSDGSVVPLFIGSDGVTGELVLFLKENDHQEELQARYLKENSDFKTEFLKGVWNYDNRTSDPIDSIADSTYAPENILFPEDKAKSSNEILDELVTFLTPNQEKLYRYLCMGLKAREIAAIFNTAEDAIKKRKIKLIARFQKLLREKFTEGLLFSGNRQEPTKSNQVSKFSDDESVSEGGN